MNATIWIQGAYLVAAVLFIVGLRMLSSPKTAPRGNAVAALGMLFAVVATLLDREVVEFRWIAAGAAVGASVMHWLVGLVGLRVDERRTLNLFCGH